MTNTKNFNSLKEAVEAGAVALEPYNLYGIGRKELYIAKKDCTIKFLGKGVRKFNKDDLVQ